MGVFEELGITTSELLRIDESELAAPPPPPVNKPKGVVRTVKPKSVAPEVLSDVEDRLEKANCYKVLLVDGLFEDAQPGTPAGDVQKEVREFVRGKLESLLGMSKPVVAPVVQAQFSSIEATILKAIVRKLVAQNSAKEPEVATAEEKLEQLVQGMPEEAEPEPEAPKATPKLKRPRAKREAQVEPSDEPAVDHKPQVVTQIVTLPNGEQIEMKSKPQARPVGIQPLPTLTKEQSERSYHSLALGQAQSLAGNEVVMGIANRITK